MGCCHSSPSRADSEAGARAAIPQGHPPAAHHPSSNSSDSLRPSATVPPSSSSRPNLRIRAPSPALKSPKNVSNVSPPWPRSHLERERQAFFDTRVAGRAVVWSALQVICELLRQGEVKQAQGIMDAANLTCPSGRVAKGRGRDRQKGGVYDERGELYDIPEWVVTDPKDLVEDTEKDVEAGAEDESEDDDLKTQRKESKGKGRAADIGDELRVRCRLSNSAMDIEVSIGSRQTVGMLITKVQEQIGDKRLRLVYLGRPLDNAKTLETQGWQRGHILNALVLE